MADVTAELQRCLEEGGCSLDKVCIKATTSSGNNDLAEVPALGCESADRGVVCTLAVAAGEVLMSIPHAFIITASVARERSEICKRLLADAEEADEDPDLSTPEQCHLAIYLLEQRRLGRSTEPPSFLQHYTSSLPRNFSNNPLYWREEDLQHLCGSYILQRIEDRRQNMLLDYDEICRIAPEMAALGSPEDFMWARSVVTSRNFSVDIDGESVEALVPVADMLNHRRPRQASWAYEQDTRSFVVRAQADLAAGQAVHDSYGRKCNARFLLNYGFAVEDNYDHDSFKCFNECALHVQLDPADPAIRVKKNLFGRRAGDLDRDKWGCVVRVSADWNDMVSREALSMARFICSRGRELLLLPILDEEVNLQETIIAPLSSATEALALHYLSGLAREQLSRYASKLSWAEDLLSLQLLPAQSNERNAKVLIAGEKEVCSFWIELEELCADLLDGADAEGAAALMERLRAESRSLQGCAARRRRVFGDYVENIVLPTIQSFRERANSPN